MCFTLYVPQVGFSCWGKPLLLDQIFLIRDCWVQVHFGFKMMPPGCAKCRPMPVRHQQMDQSLHIQDQNHHSTFGSVPPSDHIHLSLIFTPNPIIHLSRICIVTHTLWDLSGSYFDIWPLVWSSDPRISNSKLHVSVPECLSVYFECLSADSAWSEHIIKWFWLSGQSCVFSECICGMWPRYNNLWRVSKAGIVSY